MNDEGKVNKQDQEIQSGYDLLDNNNNDNNNNLNEEPSSQENNINEQQENLKNEDNNIKNEKDSNEINNKDFIEQKNIIQSQLKFICDKIESALNSFHSKKIEKEREEIDRLINNNHIDIKSISKDISSYKEHTKKIQEELDNIYNNEMINQIESDIKGKKDFIKQMKKDNGILKKATKEQEKDINGNKGNNENNEIKLLENKLKKLKEALKVTKDFHKNQEIKLKEQQNTIESLNKKSQMIKDNIDYKKKQLKNNNNNDNNDNNNKVNNKNNNNNDKNNDKNNKNTDKNNKNNDKNNNKNNKVNKLEIIDETDDISVLDEQKIKLLTEIESEEKYYKNEIQNQKNIISELKKELDILNIKVKSIEKCKKIEDLKRKEIEKMKMKVLNNQKMQNNDIIENIQKRGYSRDQTNRRMVNNLNNLNNYYIHQWTEGNTIKHQNQKYSNGELDNHFNINAFKKKTKPFEINKFSYGNNYSQRPNTDIGNLLNKKRVNKKTTLGQIEILKNEIQKTLKENDYNKIINNNNKVFDKNNEPSTILESNINNNDISEIRNDIEYLNDLKVGTGSPKQNGEKRKPFEKINFK